MNCPECIMRWHALTVILMNLRLILLIKRQKRRVDSRSTQKYHSWLHDSIRFEYQPHGRIQGYQSPEIFRGVLKNAYIEILRNTILINWYHETTVLIDGFSPSEVGNSRKIHSFVLSYFTILKANTHWRNLRLSRCLEASNKNCYIYQKSINFCKMFEPRLDCLTLYWYSWYLPCKISHILYVYLCFYKYLA